MLCANETTFVMKNKIFTHLSLSLSFPPLALLPVVFLLLLLLLLLLLFLFVSSCHSPFFPPSPPHSLPVPPRLLFLFVYFLPPSPPPFLVFLPWPHFPHLAPPLSHPPPLSYSNVILLSNLVFEGGRGANGRGLQWPLWPIQIPGLRHKREDQRKGEKTSAHKRKNKNICAPLSLDILTDFFCRRVGGAYKGRQNRRELVRKQTNRNGMSDDDDDADDDDDDGQHRVRYICISLVTCIHICICST